MIRSQLQHATGKIVDGDANCLYAAGLFFPMDEILVFVVNILSVDRLNCWITLYSIHYLEYTHVYSNNG